MGRVLVASLHQGIADIRPARLTFYENWLSSEGLREGTIGMAPLLAVLSFLRLEGEAYHTITTRAGEYAAEWTVQAMSSSHRVFLNSSPEWLRQRLVLRLARRVVHNTNPGSRAISRLGHGTADIEVTGSVFCTVREPVLQPLCGFYASALTRLFRLFDLDGRVEVVTCRGTGGSTCLLKMTLHGLHEIGEASDAVAEPPVVRRGLIT